MDMKQVRGANYPGLAALDEVARAPTEKGRKTGPFL
jgi:hypothetical protein